MPEVDRPGMEIWRILVMGIIKQGLGCDFDRLQELANEHKTLCLLLGHPHIWCCILGDVELNIFQVVTSHESHIVSECLGQNFPPCSSHIDTSSWHVHSCQALILILYNKFNMLSTYHMRQTVAVVGRIGDGKPGFRTVLGRKSGFCPLGQNGRNRSVMG